MNRLQQRAAILFELGATVHVADELLAYSQPLPASSVSAAAQLIQTPLPVEPHLAAWQALVEEAKSSNVFTALQQRFFQLRFPIRADVSQEPAYRAAKGRGDFSQLPAPEKGIVLQYPEKLKLLLHESLGGLVPVLLPNGRSDFITLIQAFGRKNEPVPVPTAMGAAIISGFVNWNRLHQLRAQWLDGRTLDSFTKAMWRQELQQRVLPHKQLYQDTFIILSDGYYSNVTSEAMGITDAAWCTASNTLRLVHESTHYLMRRLGIAHPNHLLDELIADFRAIVAANGRFRADWFLRFMGLEEYPHWRETGRLHIYRGTPPLSDDAFVLLQRLVYQAALQLENMSNKQPARVASLRQQMQLVLALATLTLEELASSESEILFEQALAQLTNERRLPV